MKKLLFLLYCLFFIYKINAQVVFCPSGAEWHYNFIHYYGYALTNESITYMGKALMANDSVKVLRHRYSFNQVNDPESHYIDTWIKEKGDTIFFQNKWTANSWQILYNFNVQAGQFWYGYYDGDYFQVNVDSVKTVVVNSVSLKQLIVQYSNLNHPVKITERFGCSEFLFNYKGSFHQPEDGGIFRDFLCYQDNSFGNVQFTNKPCDFTDYVGINEQTFNCLKIKASPNPTSGKLTIDFSSQETLELKITSSLGQEIFSQENLNPNQELDLDYLSAGIYFLKIQKANQQKILRIVKCD